MEDSLFALKNVLYISKGPLLRQVYCFTSFTAFTRATAEPDTFNSNMVSNGIRTEIHPLELVNVFI